jgi:anaerobic selenocysteine-containing dehydrogenase
MNRYPEMPDPIGRRETPIFTDRLKEGQGMYLGRAILADDPYPVRAMLVAGGNPLLTFPGSHLQTQAFLKLDFLAVFDLFMTSTAQTAHLVLPAADFLENMELHDYGVAARPYLGLVQPVVSDGAGLPIWKLIFGLARKLGLEELFPWADNRQAIAYRLAGSGVTLDELIASSSATAAYEPSKPAGDRWNTPDGSVHYYSKVLETAGHPGLPVPDAFTLPLVTDRQFPFWLSTGDRVSCFQHSQFRDNPACKAMMPEPFLDIHPEAAIHLGIGNGDYVALSTLNGKIEVRANLASEVRRDCLRLTHGWTQANANELTDSTHFDPISGFPWMRALPARIDKKEG